MNQVALTLMRWLDWALFLAVAVAVWSGLDLMSFAE